MYEIDNRKFGGFVAGLRKEKGFTQKTLAEKLFVSDKAVSKWERGLSMPDISLLVPLSEILGVTVTELLECRRMERTEHFDNERMESLVKRTINLSEEATRFKEPGFKRRAAVFAAVSVLALSEVLLLVLLGCNIEQMSYNVFLVEALMFAFGVHFWIFAKNKLPSYYDEHRINLYSDGIFRMNVPGVYFNNSNWPHILRGLRIWLSLVMVIYPPVFLLLFGMAEKLFSGSPFSGLFYLPITFFAVFSIFIPVYKNRLSEHNENRGM